MNFSVSVMGSHINSKKESKMIYVLKRSVWSLCETWTEWGQEQEELEVIIIDLARHAYVFVAIGLVSYGYKVKPSGRC